MMKFSYNPSAFQWSFPEIIASNRGYYGAEDLEFELLTLDATKITDKNATYEELLKTGKTDVYHAGEWACIMRVAEEPHSCIVGASYPDKLTLNSTFSIFVREDSGISDVHQLAHLPVAIEYGTGSYFTALQDLLEFLSIEQINLLQVGSPHLRLLALFDRSVAAASLIHPWNELAKAVSMKELLVTRRNNPTLAVTRRSIDEKELRKFFRATNRAIDTINDHSSLVRDQYVSKFISVASALPSELSAAAASIIDIIECPKWKHWTSYRKESFEGANMFLKQYSLLKARLSYEAMTHPQMRSIFGSET